MCAAGDGATDALVFFVLSFALSARRDGVVDLDADDDGLKMANIRDGCAGDAATSSHTSAR